MQPDAASLIPNRKPRGIMLRARPRLTALSGSLVVLFVAASAVLASVPGASATASAKDAAAAAKDAAASAKSKARSYNGLAQTPPMGYDDWYENYCVVSQGSILGAARDLVSSGLAKLGYDYVNIDDCWMSPKRTSKGELQPNARFPKGITWLAD